MVPREPDETECWKGASWAKGQGDELQREDGRKPPVERAG